MGNRPTKSLNRADFDELPEYEVEMIIADRRKKSRKGRYVMEYLGFRMGIPQVEISHTVPVPAHTVTRCG